MIDYSVTIGDLFVKALETGGDLPFKSSLIESVKHSTSYRECSERVAGIAKSLSAHGLQAGSRIVLYTEDIYHSIDFVLACAITGRVAVPISPSMSTRYVENVMSRVDAKAIFTMPENLESLRKLSCPIFVPGYAIEGTPIKGISTDNRAVVLNEKESIEECYKEHSVKSTDLFVIQPTSGTTGAPKFMLRDQRPFVRCAHLFSFPQADRKGTQGRRIMVNPLTHGAGIIDMVSNIALNIEGCLTRFSNLGATLEEVRKLDPHVINAVPRILHKFYDEYKMTAGFGSEPFLGPSAAVVTFGGARCRDEVKKHIVSEGVEVVEVYGTSETGILVMSEPESPGPDYAGKLFFDVEMKCAPDGELLAKSPVMMGGYLGEEQTTKNSYDEDGFYRTGDFGSVNPEGWVKILGRKKDVFSTPTGGAVFPSAIEEQIEKIPWITQVLLIGDGRPFIVALIHVDEEHETLSKKHDLNSLVKGELAQVSSRLERDQQVGKFILLKSPMPKEVFSYGGHGKIRRRRAAATELYKEELDKLYGGYDGA